MAMRIEIEIIIPEEETTSLYFRYPCREEFNTTTLMAIEGINKNILGWFCLRTRILFLTDYQKDSILDYLVTSKFGLFAEIIKITPTFKITKFLVSNQFEALKEIIEVKQE